MKLRSLRSWLLGSSVLAVLAFGPGCSSQDAGDDSDEDALGAEDSGKVVPTTQTDLLLFQGYNTVFDQGHGGCVTYPANLPVRVGDVGFDVKIAYVSSREELAQQLGFDAEAAFKLPQAGVDGRAQVMNSFKRNSTSTNLLVRVGSYYFVEAGQNYTLTAEARQLLESNPRGFIQRCGDAVVTRLQYRAEVLGLLRFDSNDQEKSVKAATGAGVNAPTVANATEASAKVQATVDRMKTATNSQINLQLFTKGFAPGTTITADALQGDAALAKLGELLKNMGDSIANDRKNTLDAVRSGAIPAQPSSAPAQPGQARPAVDSSASLGAITFHSYAKNESVPLTAITQITEDTGKFLRAVGTVEGRLENSYYEEVNAFVTAQDQETYNLVSNAVGTVQELGPIAQQWAQKIRPASADTIVGQLRDAEISCVRFAIAGDYSKCTMTPDLQRLIDQGKAQLDEYAQNGRILRMNILYGSQGEVTADNAKKACAKTGGRLPTDQEMPWLKPALAVKGGAAWVTTSQCSKGIGIYSGAAQPRCAGGYFMDTVDNVLDYAGLAIHSAPVFCVSNVGPRQIALPPPGQPQ